MRQLCDVAYVLLWEEVAEQVKSDRLVAATFKAQGFTNADKSEIELPNLPDTRREFDRNLNLPLNYERQREAVLRAVAG